MAEWGRDDLRRFVTNVLDAFIAALDQQHRGKPLSADELRRVAHTLQTSHALETMINATYRRIKDEAAHELLRNRRREPFKRLMSHPLTPLFEEGTLNRDLLGNYFNFLHLVLGEETEALSRLCVTICKDERHEDGVDWDAFYADDRAKYVLWTALHRIAASFKRFDARRDWLIGLMQNRATAKSVASIAFIPLPADAPSDEPHPFGAEQFNLMFAALYGPLKHISLEDEAHFTEAMRQKPEETFGEMWTNLERIGAKL